MIIFYQERKAQKLKERKVIIIFWLFSHIDGLFVQRLKTDKQIYVVPFGNSLVLNSGSLLT